MGRRSDNPVRLLVVERDPRYGEWLRHHLGVLCPDEEVALQSLTEFERAPFSGRECDVLILSTSFGSSPEDPRAQGLEILRQMRELSRSPAVIAVAEEGNELTAVRALQLGAVDYLPKRLLTPDRLRTSVKLAVRLVQKRTARRFAALTQDLQSKIEPRSATQPSSSRAESIVPRARLKPPQESKLSQAESKPPQDSKVAQSESKPPQESKLSQAESKPLQESKLAQSESKPLRESKLTQAEPSRSGPFGPEDSFIGNMIAAAKADEEAEAIANDDARARAGSKAEVNITANAEPEAQADGGAHPDKNANAKESMATPAQAGPLANGDSATQGAAAIAARAGANSGRLESTKPEIAHSHDSSPAMPGEAFPGGSHLDADFFPGYQIHDTLGESEKAAVYVATSTALGHRVALKVSKTLRDDTAGRQFLEREYTAIAAIREPCVVRIYDYGIQAGYEYLAMEYLPQGDLKARMQRGMSDAQALRFVEQIAAALQVVHQAGLLHRDLKPPNVMLREDGNVALIDFGLARALDGSTPSTHTGVLRGSPYYMSPEQALGEVLDARTDFYSLGVMFYEMLTGRKPYVGASAMEVLQQHVHAPVPQLPEHVSHHEPLLARLMAKSRDERFASAAEILAAIAVAREGEQAQSSAA